MLNATATATLPRPTIAIRRLGLVPCEPTLAAMRSFTAGRTPGTPDEIWLLEHEPVYTLGQAGRIEHLLRDVGVPVVRTERGGQITYHAPGQVVAYVLVDLHRRGIKVRELVALIEQSVIRVLAPYNLTGRLKPGAPGVYVEHAGELQKVAALGLRISRGCSFHGLSLNVAMDLGPYAHIDACGYPGLKSIDLAALGRDVAPATIGDELAHELVRAIETATR